MESFAASTASSIAATVAASVAAPIVIGILVSPAFPIFVISLLKYKQSRELARTEAGTLQKLGPELVLRYNEAEEQQKRQARRLEREREAREQERPRGWKHEMEEKIRVLEENAEREKKERIEGEKKTERMMKSFVQTVVNAMKIFMDLQQLHHSSSPYQRLEYHERLKLLAHFELPEDGDKELQNIFDASYLESPEDPNLAGNIEDDMLCVANLAMTTLKGQENSQDITVLELHNQIFDGFEDDSVNLAMTMDNAEAIRAKEEGNVYFKEQKFEEAIECYSKSINELPTVAAYGNRAMAYIKTNKFIEAEQDCTDALNIDDRYFKAYARRAMARTAFGFNLEGALKDVLDALALESNSQEMKDLYSQLMSLKAASEAIEEGNNLFKNQKFEEAIICYSESISESPTALAYSNRAMVYLKLDKLMEAENDCTEALNIDDQYFKAYARRAIARQKLGRNLEGALVDVEVALKLEPNNQEMMELHATLIQMELERKKSSSLISRIKNWRMI